MEEQPWYYAVLGSVTQVLQPGTKAEDGTIEIKDEVRISGIRSKVPAISSTMQEELCKKATHYIYRALDVREKIPEMFPSAKLKGLVKVV